MNFPDLCFFTDSRHLRWWSSWNCIWDPLGLCWSHRVCYQYMFNLRGSLFLEKDFYGYFILFVKTLICFLFIRGLIVPSKEKKKDKKSSLIRKLGRSKSGSVVSQSQNAPGLVGLLETMRVQMEVYRGSGSIYLYFDPFPLIFSTIMFIYLFLQHTVVYSYIV